MATRKDTTYLLLSEISSSEDEMNIVYIIHKKDVTK